MMNLNDIVQAAQGGKATENLADQFELQPAQVQQALQALLPAISMGLQQQMQGPNFAQTLVHLATPQNQAAFEDYTAAQSDETIASGSDALDHLFGSKDVTAQVATLAAQHSGVNEDLLQSMLPVVTAIVMGGLAKSLTQKGGLSGIFAPAPHAQAPVAPPESGDVLGGVLGGVFGGATGGAQRAQPAQAAPHGGGIGDILGQLAGGTAAGGLLGGLLGGAQRPQPGQTSPQAGGGLADILGGLLAGAQRPQAGQIAPQAGQAAPQASGSLADILGGLLGGAQHPQPGQATGGGLGDILGGLLAGAQRPQAGQPAPQGGGGLGNILGGVLGGAAGGGLNPALVQAGLQQLTNMFGHGTNASPVLQSGLNSILGQMLGGGRR